MFEIINCQLNKRTFGESCQKATNLYRLQIYLIGGDFEAAKQKREKKYRPQHRCWICRQTTYKLLPLNISHFRYCKERCLNQNRIFWVA